MNLWDRPIQTLSQPRHSYGLSSWVEGEWSVNRILQESGSGLAVEIYINLLLLRPSASNTTNFPDSSLASLASPPSLRPGNSNWIPIVGRRVWLPITKSVQLLRELARVLAPVILQLFVRTKLSMKIGWTSLTLMLTSVTLTTTQKGMISLWSLCCVLKRGRNWRMLGFNSK